MFVIVSNWEGQNPIYAYLRPFPPTSPSRHILLTTEVGARSLCQPCPRGAFLMSPTPRPAAQKTAQTGQARLGDVSEVLVCYALGVYETQSNPRANRVIA